MMGGKGAERPDILAGDMEADWLVRPLLRQD